MVESFAALGKNCCDLIATNAGNINNFILQALDESKNDIVQQLTRGQPLVRNLFGPAYTPEKLDRDKKLFKEPVDNSLVDEVKAFSIICIFNN